ncbi:polysaccharide biosynthesis protein [Pusillimonas sp. T7-7]|uniref:flippase n=1 Tax=Pusillimonas sp. (strain T7-7) TaxID=1007105 RepID=UPI0002084BA8|nr:flippase [Pusillimonas sp. T7-7]AEC21701.1 polysaccharide biosynthesis protein [Pusillimonas sp. T7-7]
MSLKKNAGWNLVGSGAPLLVGLLCIPYLVKQIGIEAFGILTLIWALIGYFSLFDFGLGRALTQQIAKCLDTPAAIQIPSLARVGLLFTFLTGVVGGVVLALLVDVLVYDWLNISAGLQSTTKTSLLIAALGIPLATLTTGSRGIVEAYQDFKSVNLIRLWLGVATFALPVVSVWLFGPSLIGCVAALVVARLVACVAQWVSASRRLPAGWRVVSLQSSSLKALLSQGGWMTVSNLIGPLVLTVDRFVIASLVAAGVVAYYTVPVDVMVRLLIVPSALAGALFPKLTSVLQYSRLEAAALYSQSLKAITIVMVPICLVMAAGSYWGLALWIDAEFAARSWTIASILSVGILCNSIAFVPFSTIQAGGAARVTALVNISVVCLYIPVLLVLVYKYGVVGAAIAWVFRAAIDMILLLYFARRLINTA